MENTSTKTMNDVFIKLNNEVKKSKIEINRKFHIKNL